MNTDLRAIEPTEYEVMLAMDGILATSPQEAAEITAAILGDDGYARRAVDNDIAIEAHSFDHTWGEHTYRQVSVEARLDDNSSLSITEEYNPAIENVDQVVARCADDLRLLIKRRGRA